MPEITQRYYPSLNDILEPSDLPEILSGLNGSLTNILDRVHYKNLQYSKSLRGDSSCYSLELISKKRLSVELFDSGINFILNPDFQDGQISSIPIILQYRWEVLAFLRVFKSENFSFNAKDIFKLGLKIFRISEDESLAKAANLFLNPNSNSTKLEQLTDLINNAYAPDVYNPSSPDISLNEYIREVGTLTNENPSTIVFNSFIQNISSIPETKQKLGTYFKSVIPDKTIEQYIKEIIIPWAKISLQLSAAVEIPRSLLTPVDGSTYEVIPEDPSGNPKVQMKFAEAEFLFDTRTGFDQKIEFAGTLNYPARLGNTGLIVHFTRLKLDLSKTSNIIEATRDGRPDDFMGVFAEEASIVFPQFWNHDQSNSTAIIKGRNLIIGKGGISGLISLEGTDSNNKALFRLGNAGELDKHFELGLTRFLIDFKKGNIVHSEVKGYMKIPGFKDAFGNDAQLDVSAFVGTNGDLQITASEKDGVQVFGIPNVFDLRLRSLTVGRESDKWYVEASGFLLITAEIPHVETDFLKQPIEIRRIRIWQDGSLEFVGGYIPLPTHATIKFGPVSLALSSIGFNNHDGVYQGVSRQYFVFSFNGQLDTGPGGVDVRGDGVEFHFTRDSGPFHCYLRIAGIAVDIKIPGNAKEEDADLLIKGYLAIKHGTQDSQGQVQDAGPEYQGSVSADIRKLRISAKAGMTMRPRVPAFVVDVELELPVPLPLGPTGLGIYGFRGLVGSHYVASKSYIGLPEEAGWFEYLKKKVPPRNRQGIGMEKLDPARDGLALGAGATIATMGDNGWAFSSKVFVLLSVPEMLLVEGQANILHKRLGIESESDPPFYAFIIIDNHSVQAGLGVNYNVPDNGKIMSIKGEMQLGFFFGNASAWYINLGQELPPEKRLQARLFTLFNAYAYLMINNRGIKAGAGAKFELKKKLGPVKVGLYAYIDTKGFISFKPIQIGGAIQLGGGLYLKVGRFGIELKVSAGLSAEAPKPFIISGFIKVRIKIVFIRIRIKLEFTWIFNKEMNIEQVKVIDPADFVSLPAGTSAQYPVKAVNMLTGESFLLKWLGENETLPDPTIDSSWDEFVIPMDSYIDLEFKRPVKPYTNKFGGGISPAPHFSELVAPQKARMPQLRHDFSIESIELKIWNPSSSQWVEYNPWTALSRAFTNAGLTVNTSNFPFGYWQYNNVPGKYSSVRVLAQSPFAVSNGTPPEHLGLLSQSIFCQGIIRKKKCQYWNIYSLDKQFVNDEILRDRDVNLKFLGAIGEIGSIINPFGIAPSLKLRAGHKMEIFLPEDMMSVSLRLTSLAGCRVSLYARVFEGDDTLSGLPGFTYQEIFGADYSWSDLMDALVFDAGTEELPIAKIIIEQYACPETISDIFSDYWNSVLPILEANVGNPDYNDWQNDQNSQWVNIYVEVAGGNMNVLIIEYLCQQWNLLVTNVELNQLETVVLQQWIDAYCNQTDYENSLSDLCQQWNKLLLRSIEDYPILYQYVYEWHIRFCKELPDSVFELCSLYVHELCWQNISDWRYNILLQQNNQTVINSGTNSLVNAVNLALPPIWRPDSNYLVKVTAKDNLSAGSNLANYTNSYAFGFKTDGPIGFFHKQDAKYDALENYVDPQTGQHINKSDQYKLAGLKFYIDYQRSFPNADGKLLRAKPLYYKNPKLGLFFTKAHVYEFFTKWDSYQGNPVVEYQLISSIMDPLDKPGAQPVVPEEIMGWQVHIGQQALPLSTFDIQVTNNMLTQGNPNCTGITTQLIPPTMSTSVQRDYNLLPRKLYNAVFKAREIATGGNVDSIVHNYSFETSRYADFTEHIQSYNRKIIHPATGEELEQEAKYIISVMRSDYDINVMDPLINQVFSNTLPLWELNLFQSDFDKIVFGCIRLGELNPVTGLEVSMIEVENSNTNTLMRKGILVRSPEPLNDPKLPDNEMQNSFSIVEELNPQTEFRYVISDDHCSIFITNDTMSLDGIGLLKLTFRFYKFNGESYTNAVTENIWVDFATI